MWTVVGRSLAGTGLVASVAGFVGFAALAVGAWSARAEATRRTDDLARRAHAALNPADRAVAFVRQVITVADADLEEARRGATAAPPTSAFNPFSRLAARKASESLAGSVERATTAVTTASEAAVVAEAALELFDKDDELKGWVGVRPEQLAQARTGLESASRELGRARTLFGPVPEGQRPTEEQLGTVKSALDQARDFTDRMDKAVATVRTRVDETKQLADLWVLRITIAITALASLAAVGQFFTARFCWRVLRRKPA
ncbi:hypothetical protein [Frigoriglobus tundricola]|uniref:Methyl-accepting chemotaxis protein n=1 Tax=Frigoriglobus tundricola TaxID=2774151 RepID=A0A6M5YU48_9BACT|nr:hypothetical protein [Frigoriglobus tundricola]QJW97595.1 hypothetical protein FTUN_5170 [Frigoriglobus tundricola]